ncbi:MAG TPA: hypothetical protein VFX43_14250 [Chitinophagaceae bacterium]|nr:hypothetical protein [Chitinophagaceae bacterium]
MKKLFLILSLWTVCFFAFPSASSAQSLGHDYRTGVGVKIGYWGGGALDIKHFMTPTAALEGLLSFGGDWFTITGLYEFHGPVTGAPGLLWYVGPGAHIGFWNHHYREHNDVGNAFFGVDGVLGLDYKISGAPIDLSLDIQPEVSIPDGGFGFWGGLGIRFTF